MPAGTTPSGCPASQSTSQSAARLHRRVQLPAELADVRDPRGEGADRPDLDLAAARERKPSCETSSLVTDASRSRARGPQTPTVHQAVGHVDELRRAVRRQVVREPLEVARPVGGAGDDPEVPGRRAA